MMRFPTILRYPIQATDPKILKMVIKQNMRLSLFIFAPFALLERFFPVSLFIVALFASKTRPCHTCCPDAFNGFPESRSMKLPRRLVQLSELLILSRISMSWRPSQFVPVPSLLSDQTISRPDTELCSSKKVSPVFPH